MSKLINNKKEYRQGIAFAILCAVLWGILPVYWKSLEPIPPFIIMTYRIVLVAIFAFIAAIISYGWKGIKEPLKDRKMIVTFFISGILISCNWGIYIWAVNNDYIIQTSIGYYIEPLFVCLFGVVFFHEKLNLHKLIAIILAILGVGVLLLYYRTFPVIALGLATTFATYAAIKRKYRLTAILTILYETIFLAPFALIFVIYKEYAGLGAIASGEPYQWGLLALAGILTGIPLLLFSLAANRISLVTLGITEYISPSLSLILGVFLYKEPFEQIQLVSFVIIWIGLVIFTIGEIKGNKVLDNKEEDTKVINTKMEDDKVQDRFIMAGDIKRVTGGPGGEVLFISGSEKTAIIDSGMAFCAETLIDNLQIELGDRKLDYVILTHTHYDHVGGLPYLRKAWPDLISLGASYGKEILDRPTALKRIQELSEVAWKTYMPEDETPFILMDGLSIDRVIGENDIISLGDKELMVLETPGHTTCSLSFVLEPDSIIFPGETIGVYTERGRIISPILKSYKDTMKSIDKCRKIRAKHIISPHYGQVPEKATEQYWDLAVTAAEESKDFILHLMKEGLSQEDILDEYTKAFWKGSTRNQQPLEAFQTNAIQIINIIMKEFGQSKEFG